MEFWPYTRGLRRLFITGGVLAIVAALLEVAGIAIFGYITDQVLSKQNLGAFAAPAAAWLAIALVTAAVSFTGGYLTSLGAERFLLRLRDRVYAHLQTLTPDFFENRRLGDLMARLTNDIQAIEQLVGSGAVKVVTTSASVLLFAGAAFYIRWDLALITMALIPAFLITSKFFAARFRVASARERASNGAMNSVIEECLSNQSLVQACNSQQTEAVRLHDEGDNWLRANMTQARLSNLYGPLVQVLETICMIVILGVGAWEIVAGRLTIGGLLAFAAYLGYLYPSVRSLGEIALSISEAAAGADRLMEILDARPGVHDRPEARPLVLRSQGSLEFAHVSFTYPKRRRPTLQNLSFAIQPGELVVCTGPSGAGKSTLVKLLLRFYDPDAGSILLDGIDIRDLTREALRENITVLHQESLLFSGTVRENIAYGRPSATMDEVVRAAVLADVDGFINTLPQRYETPLGQRGRLVSGGQRQRIAIARALLRDAPVLVLDEPMTGLDESTAARIMEPLQRLMAGRTTLMITHDLRHVPADARLIVLEPVVRPEPRLRLRHLRRDLQTD